MSLVVGNVYSYQCNWIPRPHRKIGIVVSARANWILWFNSEPRVHGVAQMPVAQAEHKACTRDCYLDLSSVQRVRMDEEKVATDEGPISDALGVRLVAELKKPNKMLTEFQRKIIVGNLTA